MPRADKKNTSGKKTTTRQTTAATIKKTAAKKPASRAAAKKQPALQDRLTGYLEVPKSYYAQYKTNKLFWLGVLVLGLLALGLWKKSWFVAATVNNQPISNLTLEQRLNKQYRSQTLSQMVDEALIKQEAAKKGVSVSDADVSQKLSQLEQNFGGPQNLGQLLTQQGQTREGLKDQLKIQLLIEKMYASEASVSAEEIDEFIAQNKDQLQSSDSAKQKEEAETAIKQQKLSKIFSQKFQELKQAAKVKIF